MLHRVCFETVFVTMLALCSVSRLVSVVILFEVTIGTAMVWVSVLAVVTPGLVTVLLWLTLAQTTVVMFVLRNWWVRLAVPTLAVLV